jgi:hypothetical protein
LPNQRIADERQCQYVEPEEYRRGIRRYEYAPYERCDKISQRQFAERDPSEELRPGRTENRIAIRMFPETAEPLHKMRVERGFDDGHERNDDARRFY